jgi:hypothetical protein
VPGVAAPTSGPTGACTIDGRPAGRTWRAASVADEGVKFALIAKEPDVFFTTPHFDGYPTALVRQAAIESAELREVVTEAWLAQAPKTLVKAFLAGDV